MKSKAAIALLGALASGCAGPAIYQPSPGAPSSTLTFDRGGVKAMALAFYANGSNCTEKRTMPSASAFWEGQPITLEADREYAFGLFTVVDAGVNWAGAPLGFVMLSSTTCDMQIHSFKPQANAVYKLRYRPDLSKRQCFVSMARIGADGREAPEPTHRQRQAIKTDGGGAPECAP